MGPKNEVIIHTNVHTKELSWIDRMYQKLEDICVEVDKNPSLLIQETSKYVENQMNVVGTNVKKICAELIQDLLPPTEKKFDCPIHGKCDCISAEKPKQKAYYTSTNGSDTEWGGEDIDVQEGIPLHDKKAIEVEETKLKGMDNTAINNLTRMKVEKRSTVNGCSLIKNKDTSSIPVIIENKEKVFKGDEKKPYAGGLQETENHSLSVDQATTFKEVGKSDAGRRMEHNYSHKSHRGTSIKKRLVKKRITTTSKEPEMNPMNIEEGIFLENMKAIKEEEEGGTWLQDGSKLQQDEFISADNLQANSDTTYMESNLHNSDVHSLRDNFSSNQMDGDHDESSISSNSEPAGNQADDLKVACDNFSTELCDSSKGRNSMLVSGFIEVDHGDEEQSARWLVSKSHINIFQHDNASLYLFNASSSKEDDCTEEFESDWELV